MNKKRELFEHNAFRMDSNYIVCPLCPTCKYFSELPGKTQTYHYRCDGGNNTSAKKAKRTKPYGTFDACDKYERQTAQAESNERTRYSSRPSRRTAPRRTPSRNIQETPPQEIKIEASDKNWWVAFFLCLFFGFAGFHRFYVGKIGTGILMLLTCGGFGIWFLIDLIFLIIEDFTDSEGKYIFRL